eukprot:1613748-Rhodomonas_salina.1
MPGPDLSYPPAYSCAVSGTDLPYSPTRLLCGVQYSPSILRSKARSADAAPPSVGAVIAGISAGLPPFWGVGMTAVYGGVAAIYGCRADANVAGGRAGAAGASALACDGSRGRCARQGSSMRPVLSYAAATRCPVLA